MSYSQQDFHEAWRDALNDRRTVFMVGDTVCAFITGCAFAAFVILGWLAVTGGA